MGVPADFSVEQRSDTGAVLSLAVHPRRIRWAAIIRHFELVGASALGIDDVIATDLTASRGRVQPRISGHNCYGPHKAEMIAAWMAEHGLDRAACHIRCYSDHVSDLPMLEMADEAFVTNAHVPMRLVARAKGWPELDWPAGNGHLAVALPTLPG